jgi:hypothetical protein
MNSEHELNVMNERTDVTLQVTKLYSIDMTADMIITDKNGADFSGQQDIPMTQLLSHHQNKELYLDPGDYVANWKVTDSDILWVKSRNMGRKQGDHERCLIP